jgi:hypothetical protein
MRLFELTIEDFEDEVFAISLVNMPAIEALGTYFHKDEVFFAEMKEEGLFMAPILIPNKKILRVDGAGVPYEVFFTPETIKKLAQNYLEKKYQDQVTEEHKSDVDGVVMVESWIKESVESDKSKLYGLNVPAGSWIGTFKIANEELREKFRNGELRAVSIEGMFTHLEKTPKNQLESALIMESFADFMEKDVNEFSEVEATEFLSKIKALIKKDNRMKSGKKIQMESYADYGDGVKNNAKKAVEWAEKNGWGSCGTPVGKTRASQLAKGEPISVETIKRMHSYLSRHEGDLESSTSFGEGCGYLMYQSWGGKAGLGWSRNKLRELGLLTENQAQPSVSSTYPGEVASGSIAPALFVEEPEMDIYGYETEYFYMCPGAVGTFNHLVNEMEIVEDDLVDMIRASAVFADMVFDIEADVIEDSKAEAEDLKRASILVDMFKDVFETINERTGMNHDISYMDGHIEVIKKYL